MSQKSTKKYNIPLNLFEVYDNGDGSILMMGQQFRNDLSNGNVFYGKLAPIIIDSKGNIQWLNILFKGVTMAGLDFGCANYSYAFLSNKHYFFYLDNKKNNASSIDPKAASCRNCNGGTLRAFTIDLNGKVSKKDVYDVQSINKALDKSFYTDNIQQVSENEIMFEMKKSKKESTLIKLRVD